MNCNSRSIDEHPRYQTSLLKIIMIIPSALFIGEIKITVDVGEKELQLNNISTNQFIIIKTALSTKIQH